MIAATTVSAVPVCEVSEIPEGKFKVVTVGGVELGLTLSRGAIHAVRNICPHMSAPICRGQVLGTMLPSNPGEFVFGLEEQVVVCPWHQWEFDLMSGRPAFTNAKGRLRVYSVEVRDGVAHVDLGRGAGAEE